MHFDLFFRKLLESFFIPIESKGTDFPMGIYIKLSKDKRMPTTSNAKISLANLSEALTRDFYQIN